VGLDRYEQGQHGHVNQADPPLDKQQEINTNSIQYNKHNLPTIPVERFLKVFLYSIEGFIYYAGFRYLPHLL
jgi:hypothetical protein